MTYTVEKDWMTDAGLRAVVIMGALGFRCGYVGIGKDHPIFEADYNATNEFLGNSPDSVLNAHGGITYSGCKSKDYPVESDLWWFGFDCGHLGDCRSPEYIAEQRERYPDKPFMWCEHDGVHRSLSYCAHECEKLAEQLAAINKATT